MKSPYTITSGIKIKQYFHESTTSIKYIYDKKQRPQNDASTNKNFVCYNNNYCNMNEIFFSLRQD